MAGFAKTLAIMVAGAALSAGGFVVAVAMPQIRGALGGSDAFATVSRTPDGAAPTTADGLPAAPDFGTAAPTFDSSAPAFGTATNLDHAAAAADAFDSLGDSSFGPPPAAASQTGFVSQPQSQPQTQPASQPAIQPAAPPVVDPSPFGAATEFGTSNEFATDPPASSPPASVPANPQAVWAEHVDGLKKAGVKDFQILPAGVGMVRMIVWLGETGDARVSRQIQGQGETPTAAAAAALKAINEYRASADWLDPGAE